MFARILGLSVGVVSSFALLTACSTRSDRGRNLGGEIDMGALDAGLPFDGAFDAADDANATDAGRRLDGRVFVPPIPSDVDVAITADNAYSFGYGSESGITTFYPGTRATSAGQIFNCPIGEGPEHYVVPAADAPSGAYLYIVTWDDHSVTQGVLAQFKRTDATLYSGDHAFEVCATGMDFTTASGPTQEQVNAEILNCNAGTGNSSTTSAGWVNNEGPVEGTPDAVGVLAVGEANLDDATAGERGEFPQVCVEDAAGEKGIETAAHWMWYDPQDGTATRGAFRSTGTNSFRAFLIFRLPADSIVLF